MKFIYFIIPFLLFSDCLAVSCRSGGKDVESWLILTPPGARTRKATGSYKANGGEFGYRVAVLEEGANDYTELKITTRPSPTKVAEAIAQIFLDHLAPPIPNTLNRETLQFTVQDQPAANGQQRGSAPPKSPLEPKTHFDKFLDARNIKKNNEKFNTKNEYLEEFGWVPLPNIDYYMKASHSKWLVSFDITNKKGFFLAHSLTMTPHNPWSTPAEVFPTGEAIHRFDLAQHMFCKSLDADMKLLLEAVNLVFPPIVDYNFDLKAIRTKYGTTDVVTQMLDLIELMTLKTKSEALDEHIMKQTTCYAEYLDKKSENYKGCAVPRKLTKGYLVVGHYPLPRLYPSNHGVANYRPGDDLSVPSGQIKVNIDDLGPFPWNVVATIANTNLVLHHYPGTSKRMHKKIPIEPNEIKPAVVKGNFFQQPCLVDPPIVEIRKIKVMQRVSPTKTERGTEGYSAMSSHAKIAYGTNTYRVCVGDANHVVEHIHHAGIAICFDSETLQKQLKTWTIADEEVKGHWSIHFEDDPKEPGTSKINIVEKIQKNLLAQKAEVQTTEDKGAEGDARNLPLEGQRYNNNIDNNVIPKVQIPEVKGEKTPTSSPQKTRQSVLQFKPIPISPATSSEKKRKAEETDEEIQPAKKKPKMGSSQNTR